MKLYIGDYLGDTQHLSCLEHGAYLLLIMAYWQNGGPIENNPKLLRRLTRTDPKTFQKVSENVLKMFRVEGSFLVHARIEKELTKREQVSMSAKNAINARWYGRNTDVSGKEYERNTTPIVHSPLPKIKKENTKENMGETASKRFTKPSIEEVSAYCIERKNNVNPERWMNHYESKGWKIGKAPMKDWKAAVRTWEGNDFPPRALKVNQRSSFLEMEE